MARWTNSYDNEHGREGATPRWFVVRHKADLGNLQCPAALLGTATDHGYDPAIGSIAMTTKGTDLVCEFPTRKGWSAGVNAMLFRLEIEGNATADLTVDISWYEACYGNTGLLESWRLIATDYGVSNGDTKQVVNDGGRIFPHIDGISNPDGSASLYLSARTASAIQVVGAGGSEAGGTVIDEGVESIGMKGWYSTTNRWVKIAVDSAGNLVLSGLAAAAVVWAAMLAVLTTITGQLVTSLADSLAIKTAIQILDDIVGTHDSAAGTKGAHVMGKASAGVPAAVGDGDSAHMRMDLTGSPGVHLTAGLDYTTSSVETREKPPTGGATGTTNISNAASTALNAGVSLACVSVTVINNSVTGGWMRVGIGTQTATTGIPLQPGDSRKILVDDVAKVQGWAQNLNDPCGWDYASR